MSKSVKALLAVVVCFFANVQCHEILDDFLSFSDESSPVKLTKSCAEDLRSIKHGIKRHEIWALKVLDASGKTPVGYTWGNSFWLGAHRACELLNNPPKIILGKSATRKMFQNMTDVASEVLVEYRMFYANHTSPIQFDADLFVKNILHIGLCFPKSCDDLEARVMAKSVFERKFNKALLFGNVTFLRTKRLEIREKFMDEPMVLLFLVISASFILLTIAGTLYMSQAKKERKEMKSLVLPSNDSFKKVSSSMAEKFWSCFSIKSNSSFIMSTKLDKKSIPTVHGIRAVGALWIFAGHVYYYAFGPTENLQLIFAYADSWILQPFFSAAISVDSFYVMSGFLLAYQFFEKQKKRPSQQLTVDVIKGIVYRYIRIAPCFMIVMLLAVTLSIFLNDTSQFVMIENIELNCKLNWWKNLLFIQNFFPLDQMCMSWSWYVATDFQLFALCSVLLAISAKNMRLSVIIGAVLVAASAAFSGYVGVTESFGFSLDSQFRSINTLYTKPYTRIGPYIAGVCVGYYLSSVNRQWNIRKSLARTGRYISIIVMLFIVFVQRYRVSDNFWVSLLFPAFGRSLWALPICFLIFAGSTSSPQGLITRLLNSRHLRPLSRMTFSAYLLNPLVVFFLTMSSETPFHLDFYTIVIFTFGFYILTYFGAFAFMLLFENPIIMFVRKFAE